MANILTYPNRNIVNIPELQNVVTSATGSSNNYSITQLLATVDTTAHLVKTNTLQTYSGNNITIKNNLYLSNAGLYYNNVPWMTTQGINATNALVLNVNTTEMARITSAGYVGIGTTTPSATLDVNGNAVVRGNLYVSTTTTTPGNAYAAAFLTPSDPSLKTDVQPFVLPSRLPRAVEFTWIASGKRDIGFLADDVAEILPWCVSVDSMCGRQHVDYSKLVTLCMAEIVALKERMSSLESVIAKQETQEVVLELS
jgi:hypothetical protein